MEPHLKKMEIYIVKKNNEELLTTALHRGFTLHNETFPFQKGDVVVTETGLEDKIQVPEGVDIKTIQEMRGHEEWPRIKKIIYPEE
jgi:hypothetical protein